MSPIKTALFACLLPLGAIAAPETYSIDPVHSFPNFSIVHLGMSTIHGRFDKTSGKITLDRAAKTGSLEVKIEMASVSSGYAKSEPGSFAAKTYGPVSRDEVLRGADFFNVAEFHEAVYKGSKFNFNGDNLESIDGTLTLMGVTKPVKLTVSAFKCAPHPFFKKDMCGADAATSIKRSEFGMNMKGLGAAVGDEVKMTFGIEAYKD